MYSNIQFFHIKQYSGFFNIKLDVPEPDPEKPKSDPSKKREKINLT